MSLSSNRYAHPHPFILLLLKRQLTGLINGFYFTCLFLMLIHFFLFSLWVMNGVNTIKTHTYHRIGPNNEQFVWYMEGPKLRFCVTSLIVALKSLPWVSSLLILKWVTNTNMKYLVTFLLYWQAFYINESFGLSLYNSASLFIFTTIIVSLSLLWMLKRKRKKKSQRQMHGVAWN